MAENMNRTLQIVSAKGVRYEGEAVPVKSKTRLTVGKALVTIFVDSTSIL